MAHTDAIFAKVDAMLDEMYPQMEAELLALLGFASVRGDPVEGAPFGRPIAQALDYTLALAANLGLNTENMDGYMGLAELPGQSAEQVGVLTHLDVVPAKAEDWHYSPYEPVVENGRIYGRGTLDNKGPLIASLFAGLALAHCSVPLCKSVLFMFGCDEESHFECVSHYLVKRQPPGCGFSPDGRFPLVIGEKGLGSYELRANWPVDAGEGNLWLQELIAGNATNTVPDIAQAVFEARQPELVTEHLTNIPAGIKTELQGTKLCLTAYGKATHASLPEEGENALSKLIQYLSKLNFSAQGAKQYLDTLVKLLVDDSYGSGLGIAAEDEHSCLTNVPTVLRMDSSSGRLTCDMRFPVTHQSAHYEKLLRQAASANGLDFSGWQTMEPLFATEEHSVAAGLLKAYRDFTGDNNPPLIVGSATYAKMIPNFFAFGPCFNGKPFLAHQADEYIDSAEWLQTAKIYARAIYELAK